MEIFLRLLFGHLLADFTFQTNYLAAWKRRSIYGLLFHVLLHPLCYLLLVYPMINDVWVTYGGISFNGWACIFIAGALHFVEDYIRVDLINRGWTDNTLFYIWDQVVHILVLWLFSPDKSIGPVTSWPIIGIFFVVVTHFATVSVWFVEKDIYGRNYPETEEKYISILQRLVVWMAFFLPSPFYLIVAVFFILMYSRHIWKRRLDFSWASVVLGNLLAVICGAWLRFGFNIHL